MLFKATWILLKIYLESTSSAVQKMAQGTIILIATWIFDRIPTEWDLDKVIDGHQHKNVKNQNNNSKPILADKLE